MLNPRYRGVMQLLLSVSLTAATLAAPLRASALSTDKNQPMKITADQVNIDDKTGISVYSGDVVVVQGTLRITADTLSVYTKKHVLTKMIAIGKPATYKQRPDGKQTDVHARASRMEYYAGTDRVILIGDARLRQDANSFVSKRIIYDLKRDQVDAGKKIGGGRVEIVIQPKSNGQGPAKP